MLDGLLGSELLAGTEPDYADETLSTEDTVLEIGGVRLRTHPRRPRPHAGRCPDLAA